MPGLILRSSTLLYRAHIHFLVKNMENLDKKYYAPFSTNDKKVYFIANTELLLNLNQLQ